VNRSSGDRKSPEQPEIARKKPRVRIPARVAAEEQTQKAASVERGVGDEFWSPARSALPGLSARRRLKVGAAGILMEGVVFGESPRWHDGRLWFSDWGANQVIALGTDGSHEVVVTVASFPMCIDFLGWISLASDPGQTKRR
jgi:hypothetical protein